MFPVKDVLVMFGIIYIPHWLDSMVPKAFLPMRCCNIYIPHWLDSMGEIEARRAVEGGFTFHTG